MTRILPFRGWRYASDIDADAVLAPPYDVISPAQRQTLADRHPNNIVNLTLPQSSAAEGRELDPYENATRLFKMWSDERILRQDPIPAIYLLRQRFTLPDGAPAERLGFIAQLRLAAWGDGILPHERTFPQAKADRLALLKATGLHDSPLFMLYQDTEQRVGQQLARLQQLPPTTVYQDDNGVEHELWVIQEPPILAKLNEELAERTFYLADGHHRWETALNYQAWRREQDVDVTGDQPYDYMLVYFAAMEDPGTVILPAHRVVKQGRSRTFDDLITSLQVDFSIQTMPTDASLIDSLLTLPAGTPGFGLIYEDCSPQMLTLLPSAEQHRRLLADQPAPVAALPAAILQTLILGPHFGISSDPQTQKTQISFEPNASAAADLVRSGNAQAVFLTTATSMDQLRAIADSRSFAPAKATYFYPKLPSGLVLSRVK